MTGKQEKAPLYPSRIRDRRRVEPSAGWRVQSTSLPAPAVIVPKMRPQLPPRLGPFSLRHTPHDVQAGLSSVGRSSPEFIEPLDRGSRPGEDPRLHWGMDAFTEVVNPGPQDDHDCHNREYRQQIAVPLDGRMDMNTHGLVSSGGSSDQTTALPVVGTDKGLRRKTMPSDLASLMS
jgi:hypothetical protein